MDYTLKSPVSDLPQITFATSESTLHLIKYPFSQGYQFPLEELTVFLSGSGTEFNQYTNTAEITETASYIEFSDIENLPITKSYVFPPPTSSTDPGEEGNESWSNRFHYIYSYGFWRRRTIREFNV